ncbi:MAG: cytochrome c biogenesis protein CcsA [Vicinamibacterales bacterium]
MRTLFVPLVAVTAAMFVYSPIYIANVPYESTMLLVQKIFYYHFPTWIAGAVAVLLCGAASAWYLFKGSAVADRVAVASAELGVVFGAFGLVSGTLWGRKAWGTWWAGDARTSMALVAELIFFGYLLVRRYGGPGSEKLAAAMGIFGAATAPFIYKSVDWWRTIHPKTSVMGSLTATEGGTIMWGAVMYCTVTFMLLLVVVLQARVRLEELRARVDQLYLSLED